MPDMGGQVPCDPTFMRVLKWSTPRTGGYQGLGGAGKGGGASHRFSVRYGSGVSSEDAQYSVTMSHVALHP